MSVFCDDVVYLGDYLGGVCGDCGDMFFECSIVLSVWFYEDGWCDVFVHVFDDHVFVYYFVCSFGGCDVVGWVGYPV